ncbi:transport protein particle component [Xylariomycetidae sp. FL2044]|nr:transport protein particle component [Xylariomycetidae sp. FL2044]KAH9887548.1 transport protein particle component [Xylariomycetidae sp. FL2044]
MSSFDQPLPPFNASDPSASFLSTSCLDFLLIELVPMTYRVTNEVDALASESSSASSTSVTARQQQQTGGGGQDDGTAAGSHSSHNATATATATATTTRGGGGKSLLDEDEERDAVFYRLETLGYRVGLGLVERFSRDRPRFNDTLDAIKFVCKDLWMLVFKKQVDNLKTNHRGVYVLTDNVFRPLSRMSTDTGGQAVARAQPFLWFPCGILRGALAAMGITATVQAETSELPGAVFQIKTVPTKP